MEAVQQFKSDAEKFAEWEDEWQNLVYATGGFESGNMELERMRYNTRMADFETNLLDLEEGGGVSFLASSLFLLFSLLVFLVSLLSLPPLSCPPLSVISYWRCGLLTDDSIAQGPRPIQTYPLRAPSMVRLRRSFLPFDSRCDRGR
jgi:hypothetical protein